MAWSHEAAAEMKGKDKPAKKVSHVTVKHSANGGHIITHHHTAPEHHPDEDHTTKGDAAMMAHMQQAMPDQNPPAAPDAGAAPDMAAGAPPMASSAPAPGM